MAKLKNSAKEVYYQNVKPNIDKAMTNPFTAGLIGAVPGVIGSYFYKPDFDARKAKTQDEAYKMARSTGAKTFIWNGKRYNTDYKGNPKKTLVQQKQEELDTYGITNEQTQNKNLIADRLHNNIFPYGYENPVSRFINAVIFDEKDIRNKETKSLRKMTRDDLFGLTLGYPQKYNTLEISDYKPKEATDDYYYKLKEDQKPFNIKEYIGPTNEELSNMTLDELNKISKTKLYSGKNYSNIPSNIEPIVSKLNILQTKYNELREPIGNRTIPTYKRMEYLAKNKKELNELEDSIEYLRIKIPDISNIPDTKAVPLNKNMVSRTENLGQYTIGRTKDYLSYYDKWDINPFGSGNDKSLYQLGKPLNIYDRNYFDENNTKKSLGGDIMIKKKNKFVVPQEYNQSVIFAKGGNLYSGLKDMSSYLSAVAVKAPAQTPGLGAYLGAAQGAMQLGSQAINNFDTPGIGSEVAGTNDISRGDILNTNVNVDSRQTNTGGQALSGAMTGAQAGMALGPLGAGIGAGVGLLAGGISSIIGNNKKQKAADLAEQQWTNNLEAKNRQFNQQDLRQSMANFSAMGGDLFAYGGQMPQQLTEFNTSGTHEENPNGGIMQGTGANGKPNLVEEGETKHEDYIFSDRLKINPQISKDFKLPKGLNGKTFAQASKYLNREAKDRPNDPISNNAVKAQLAKLTAAQEGLKAQMQPQQGIPMEGQPNANILEQGQQFAYGGDQTHYHNPTWQGANIGAGGMPLTKLNTPIVGIDQNAYARNMKLQGIDWKANPLSNVKDINVALKEGAAFRERNPYQQEEEEIRSNDSSRYAPVVANMAMGISDMFEKPEVVKYGRVNPERVTARMDYQPIDTEWMNNKMNATYAGTRDQMINNAGGNRAIAMAGLSGINQQQQNAVGEAYMKAQDINYGRKNQATQFNAGIEAQNIAAQNAAQQANLQLQMQEMDANARNRAAKRNAARQAILNAASNIGDIGRENFNANTVKSSTGYKYDQKGNLLFDVPEGTTTATQVYKNGKWINR